MKTSYPVLLNLFRFQYRLITNSCPLSVQEQNKEASTVNRLYRLYCTPAISDVTSKKIESVVGLQIGLSYVSWARIETKTNFLSHLNFLSLPVDMNKMELHQIYTVAHKTLNTIPSADCYVMENLPKIVSASSGKLQLTLQATRMQLISMLVAMLNMKSDESYQPVMFIKPRVTARLFNLLIGSETVSSHGVISKLLVESSMKPFTPITCCPDALKFYNQSQNVDKEILGQAFLVTVSFAELMLYKNQECYKILLGDSKKNLLCNFSIFSVIISII
ncbi:uncharacterized protein LOC135846376 [Planococcus citri]|uniref:uncharacterized protein LOC135846376 n=1 Tax=Planococcus citri TaxID=170843 RepID=UPI0031F9EA28